MKFNLFIVSLFVLLVVGISAVCSWRRNGNPDDRILLSDVKVLTLEKGKMTTSRRSAPIPQLQCVGGSAYHYPEYFPSVVQCYNVGTNDRGEIQWRCDADLDTDVKFGKITVSCEGYDSPHDPYILQGSCGLEYHLEFTNSGLQRQHQRRIGRVNEQRRYEEDVLSSEEESSLVGFLIFFFFAMLICLCCCAMKNHNRTIYPTPIHVSSTLPHTGMEFPMPNSPLYSVPPPPPISSSSSSFESFATGFATGTAVGYTAARATSPTATHIHYHSGTSTLNNSSSSSSSSSSSDISSSRTASGFGGTKKR